MPAGLDSDSDSEQLTAPSTVHRQRHKKVVLSDSDADSPGAAGMAMLGSSLGSHAAAPVPTCLLAPSVSRISPAAAARAAMPACIAGHAVCQHMLSAQGTQRPQHRSCSPGTDGLAASVSQMDLGNSAAAQPADCSDLDSVTWPDASSPGFAQVAAAPGGNSTAAAPWRLPTVPSDGSASSVSSSGLAFTRSVRRGAQRLTLSDSELESASRTAPTDVQAASPTTPAAAPDQAVRRLTFAVPEPSGQPSAGRDGNAGGSAVLARRRRALVQWADGAASDSEAAVLASMRDLQLGSQLPAGAEPDAAVDLCLSPQPDACSSPGSPELTWTATHTPRRRQRAVLSDSSDSEAAEPVAPAAGPASAAAAAAVLLSDDSDAEPAGATAAAPTSPSPTPTGTERTPVTPWRCTPPWHFSVSRAQPRPPVTAPAPVGTLLPLPTSDAAATPPAAPASPAETTPEWLSAYTRPAVSPVAATRGNLVAIEAAAKPAAPRVRRASVRLPPQVITIGSSDDEAQEWPDCTPGGRLPTAMPAAGNVNDGRSSAIVSVLARPLQPHNFATPQPVARPAGRRSATTTRKKASLPFARQREEMTRSLFLQYNAKVFGGRLPADLQITWSKTLLKTAGMTYYTRKSPTLPGGSWRYDARVELSAKVLDRAERLELTLAHELCHVAAWVIDHTAKPAHGLVFYGWAACFRAPFPHLTITTRHSYDIHYAFRWQCTNAACGKVYGRHSNSLDTDRKVCGMCRARLEPLGRFNADGTPAKARTASAFSLFVKDNFAVAKAAAGPQTPHREVMKVVADMWKQQKQAASSTSLFA